MPDCDLCQNCITEASPQHFSDMHQFLCMEGPRKLVVTQVYDGGDSHLINEELCMSPKDKGVKYNVGCDLCEHAIWGVRHKCIDCKDYDLCTACITNTREVHDITHTFIKLSTPGNVFVHHVLPSQMLVYTH